MKHVRTAPFFKILPFAFVLLLCLSCSGGGGGGGDGTSTGGGDGSGDPVSNGGLEVWRAEATVASDGCRERIANVKQTFRVTRNGDSVTVDDTLVTLSGTATDDGFTVGFTGVSGECVRDYEAAFSAMTDTAAVVQFRVRSNCGGAICQNEWIGTATRDLSSGKEPAAALEKPKVTGEQCVHPIPEIGFRPSLYECFGNAAVLARGFVRSAYSIVVRRNGQFNDRDPNNTACESARCSPYKTQQKIELPEYQVHCLGDSGFSPVYNEVTRISVKFTALVEDSLDPSQFQQYCLNSKHANLN